MPQFEDTRKSGTSARTGNTASSRGGARPTSATHPMMQLQRAVGNQATQHIIQRNPEPGGSGGGAGGGGSWFGGFSNPFSGFTKTHFPNFSNPDYWKKMGSETMRQTVREAVSKGISSDSADIYDFAKAKDKDAFVLDRIHRMDGEFN